MLFLNHDYLSDRKKEPLDGISLAAVFPFVAAFEVAALFR